MPNVIKDSTPLIALNFHKADLVIVDFWAEWCPPCKGMVPTLDQICEQMPNVKVVKINIDEEPETAERFDIQSIPTFLFFKNDGLEPVRREVGAMSKKDFEEIVKSVIKGDKS